MSALAVSEFSPSAEAAVPLMADARRAADELLNAGVGTVLVFGSVACGVATAASDIDLVAIYNDLGDYQQRHQLRFELQRRARDVAGWPVDVFVTDAPEWAIRTTEVRCSLEAGIALHAVKLAEITAHAPINWGKEIGMPASVDSELSDRLADLCNGMTDLTLRLKPSDEERAAAAAGQVTEHFLQELHRFTSACGAVHQIFEAAAKVTLIITTNAPAPYTHDIDALLSTQPSWVRDAFATAARSIDLSDLAVWHVASNYIAARPIDQYDAEYLRLHGEAALRIAAFAAEQCQQRDIDPGQLQILEQRRRNSEAAVERPQRVPVMYTEVLGRPPELDHF